MTSKRNLTLTLAWVMVVGIVWTSPAGARSFFTSRRLMGCFSLAGSGYFFKEAWDYREKADEVYRDYEQARTEEDAESWYKKTSRYDIRSEINLIVGSLLALNGLRLLIFGEPDEWQNNDLALRFRRTSLHVEGDVRDQAVRMKIKRHF